MNAAPWSSYTGAKDSWMNRFTPAARAARAVVLSPRPGEQHAERGGRHVGCEVDHRIVALHRAPRGLRIEQVEGDRLGPHRGEPGALPGRPPDRCDAVAERQQPRNGSDS